MIIKGKGKLKWWMLIYGVFMLIKIKNWKWGMFLKYEEKGINKYLIIISIL